MHCFLVDRGRGRGTELQKSCGYAGITREEGLPFVRLVRKVYGHTLHSIRTPKSQNKL